MTTVAIDRYLFFYRQIKEENHAGHLLQSLVSYLQRTCVSQLVTTITLHLRQMICERKEERCCFFIVFWFCFRSQLWLVTLRQVGTTGPGGDTVSGPSGSMGEHILNKETWWVGLEAEEVASPSSQGTSPYAHLPDTTNSSHPLGSIGTGMSSGICVLFTVPPTTHEHDVMYMEE